MVDFQKVIQADREQGRKHSFSSAIAPVSSQLSDFFKKNSMKCMYSEDSLEEHSAAPSISTMPLVSEKTEVLHSMKEFIRPKLETSLSTPIKGGEILSKEDSSHVVTTMELNLSYQSWEDYLHAMNKCRICSVDTFKGSVHQFAGKELQAPIDVLFVIDRPKDMDVSCFDEQGEVNDSLKWQEVREHYFVGEKELMVQRMVQKMNLHPSKYALTSIIKCSVKNKAKVSSCQTNCLSHLLHEIYFLRPKVIVTFGAWSSEVLRGKSERLSTIHGQFYPYELKASEEIVEGKIVPLFHPDLLFINNDMKKTTWIDMQKIMDYLSSLT